MRTRARGGGPIWGVRRVVIFGGGAEGDEARERVGGVWA
jgi:hypothetical protein